MDAEQLYNRLKLIKNKRDRPIFLVLGDCKIVHEASDIIEAKDCDEHDADGIYEMVEDLSVPKNSIIIRL